MAKVIKFNLRCDGNPVRTIEDLQENFSLEDVLSYYDNKLLHKWLSVRGYEEELEKVNAITSDAQGDIIKSLADIFEIDEDPATLDEKITILNYERDKRNIFEKAKESGKGHAAVVSNYISRYEQLVQEILELEIFTENGKKPTLNDVNFEKIRNNFLILGSEFSELFKITYENVLAELFSGNMCALAFLLENEKLRNVLPIENGIGHNCRCNVGEYAEESKTYYSLMKEAEASTWGNGSKEKGKKFNGELLGEKFMFVKNEYRLKPSMSRFMVKDTIKDVSEYEMTALDKNINIVLLKKHQNDKLSSKKHQIFLEIVQNDHTFWISFLEV